MLFHHWTLLINGIQANGEKLTRDLKENSLQKEYSLLNDIVPYRVFGDGGESFRK